VSTFRDRFDLHQSVGVLGWLDGERLHTNTDDVELKSSLEEFLLDLLRNGVETGLRSEVLDTFNRVARCKPYPTCERGNTALGSCIAMAAIVPGSDRRLCDESAADVDWPMCTSQVKSGPRQ
jgi:hypothetical protein